MARPVLVFMLPSGWKVSTVTQYMYKQWRPDLPCGSAIIALKVEVVPYILLWFSLAASHLLFDRT